MGCVERQNGWIDGLLRSLIGLARYADRHASVPQTGLSSSGERARKMDCYAVSSIEPGRRRACGMRNSL